MQINSRLFGDIEIDDSKIITFENGILGFEKYKTYAIVYNSEKETKNGIMWLQSMEEPTLAFPVMDPMHIDSDYNPIVEDEWLAPIGKFDSVEELYILNILTVPADLTKMTCNMKAPLIINTVTRKGCQLIVNNEEYLVRFNVYDFVQNLKNKEDGQC